MGFRSWLEATHADDVVHMDETLRIIDILCEDVMQESMKQVLETKLRVYQASVLSVLLYGSECWPISTSLCSRLSVFDMQAQRTITNTKWFEYKTNIEVRTLTNRQPIQIYIAQGRLRWFGHLLRSPLNHPALAIYTFNPRSAGWSRPRGAPRTRWSDVLGKYLK